MFFYIFCFCNVILFTIKVSGDFSYIFSFKKKNSLLWILFFRFSIHVIWSCSCLIAFLLPPFFSISFLTLLILFFLLCCLMISVIFLLNCSISLVCFILFFYQYFSFFYQLLRGIAYSILFWFPFCYNLVYLIQNILQLIVFLLCGLIRFKI